MLTFEEIRELIELVDERKLQGVEIERAGFRVRIDGRGAAPAAPVVAAAPVAVAPAAAAPAPAAAPAQAPPAGDAAVDDGLHVLRSPIVGTYYSSSSPEADPYVRAGDRVKKGQVLCIVEAMKLMNEIESDIDGTVAEVLVKNAQPVEFNEPIFHIRPD